MLPTVSLWWECCNRNGGDTLFNIFYSKCPQSVSAANQLTTQWRVVLGMQLPLTVGQQQSCSSSVFLLCSKVAIDQVAASLEQNKADHVSSKKWHLKAEFSQRPHFKTMSGMEGLHFLALFSMYVLQLWMMRLVEPGVLSDPSSGNSLLEKSLWIARWMVG